MYEVKTVWLMRVPACSLAGVGLLGTKEGRGLALPTEGLCARGCGRLPRGARWPVRRFTRVAGTLQKAAGDSQVCPRPQPSQPRLCKHPRTGAGSWGAGGVDVWGEPEGRSGASLGC